MNEKPDIVPPSELYGNHVTGLGLGRRWQQSLNALHQSRNGITQNRTEHKIYPTTLDLAVNIKLDRHSCRIQRHTIAAAALSILVCRKTFASRMIMMA